VAPIGADLEIPIKSFRAYFESIGYKVVPIKVTDIFHVLSKYIIPTVALKRSPSYDRYITHIKYGDQLREHFSDDAILAVTSIGLVARQRARLKSDVPFTKAVYLLYQFKRKEEIDLLRSVYGDLFFQISVYSRRGARVDSLSRIFSHSEFVFNSQNYRNKAEEVVQIDDK
jgi:hypothetical protein